MSKPSRTALVHWVNDVLELQMTKVDEFGTGAVYCQLIDSIFGDVPMSRVKFKSRLPFDHEQNYKVLQQELQRHGIRRTFDRQRLMQCRLQDNLDFTQWLYAYWHEVGHIPDYNPVARRQGATAAPSIRSARSGKSGVSTPGRPGSSRANSLDSTDASRNHRLNSSTSSWDRSRNGSQSSAVSALERSPSQAPGPFATPRTIAVPESSTPEVIEVAVPEVQKVISENEELRQSVDILLAERDLYYEKLTVIEELVNNQVDALYAKWGDEAAMEREADPFFLMMRRLQGILYSRPDGFEPPHQLDDEPF